jgi:hypothetical protein
MPIEEFATVTFVMRVPNSINAFYSQWGTGQTDGSQLIVPIVNNFALDLIENKSNLTITSANVVLTSTPHYYGPHELNNYNMTELFTIYTNFGTAIFSDVKVGNVATFSTPTAVTGNITSEPIFVFREEVPLEPEIAYEAVIIFTVKNNY